MAAKETALTNVGDGINVKWFNVFPGVARYRVLVYPSWSKTTAGTGVATTVVNATVPNSGFPPGYAIPGVGGVARLQVGPNNLVGISSVAGATAGSKAVTYHLAAAVTIPSGTSAYANLAFPTTNPSSPGTSQTVTKGSAATPLVLNINAVSAIPQKNGEFMDNTSGRLYAYRTARVVGANVQLENISWNGAGATATFPENSYLVFSQTARLDATGDAAGGLTQTQKSLNDAITLFSPGSSLPPPGPNQSPPALPAVASGFSGNLDALDLTKSGNRVVVQGYIATGGTHAYWAAFQHLGEASYRFEDPEEAGRWIGYHAAPISTEISDNLRNGWMQYHSLSYDVQIKLGWDLNLPYAAQGLTFRWHESPDCAAAVTCPPENSYCCYEGYGISFMRYTAKNHGSSNMIPNTVKPDHNLREKLLLVLWEQKINASNVATKDWLAYAELGDPSGGYHNPATERHHPDPDQKVTGYQGWPGGRLNDDSTIIVRVEDKFVTT